MKYLLWVTYERMHVARPHEFYSELGAPKPMFTKGEHAQVYNTSEQANTAARQWLDRPCRSDYVYRDIAVNIVEIREAKQVQLPEPELVSKTVFF